MINIKKAILYTLVTMSILFIAGCYKVTTLYPNPDDVTLINKEVSLINDINPMFSQNCAISGCHNTGGTSPDLTASKSYNSLINGGYVNVADPKSSKIYLRLTGKISPAMPLNNKNNPSNINAYVLTWITQGAKNN